MEKEQEQMLAYGALLIALFALAFVAYSALKPAPAGLQHTAANYQQFVSAESAGDICKTPAGYTDEQWKEHMSHHPDRYAQCLKGSG